VNHVLDWTFPGLEKGPNQRRKEKVLVKVWMMDQKPSSEVKKPLVNREATCAVRFGPLEYVGYHQG